MTPGNLAKMKESFKSNVQFMYFRDNCLWYKTVNGFMFPIPVEDVQGTTVNKIEKGSKMMRWMRKEFEATENPDYSNEQEFWDTVK